MLKQLRCTIARLALMLLVAVGCEYDKVGFADEAKLPQPNVIVILSDDQRAQDLGLAGHPVVKTPHIDALAKRGTYFTEAFVTTAACTPSRTSILLGQYERRHGVTFGSQSALTEEAFARTYPMLLKTAGYYTGYIGKNHSPVGKSDRGFGYQSQVMEREFDYWYGGHGHLGFYPKAQHPIFRGARADTQVEILAEAANRFLDADKTLLTGAQDTTRHRPREKPFCLLVNFNVPHSAGTLSMKQRTSDLPLYRTAYRDQKHDFPIPPSYSAAREIQQPKIPRNVYNGNFIASYDYVKSPASLREHEIRECQTITGVDNLVGQIVAELHRQRIADNTIIVYFSDHGIQHGEFGLGGKVLLYEPSIRVPLIAYDPRLPEVRQGNRVDQMALSIDIAPTLLDLCGTDPPDGIQGRSLAPLMRGEAIEWRQDFFLENMYMGQNYPRMESVRNEQYKYIRYFDKKNDQHHFRALTASIRGEQPIYEELFDLQNDPLEATNLATDPAATGLLNKVRVRCQSLVAELRGGAAPDTHVKGI